MNNTRQSLAPEKILSYATTQKEIDSEIEVGCRGSDEGQCCAKVSVAQGDLQP